MKRLLSSLLIIIMACCNVNAQDYEELMMFKPGGNTIATFPAGTNLILSDWPTIGVNISPGLDATSYKQLGIEFHDNLESNDIHLWYEVNNSGTKIPESATLSSGENDYQLNITGMSESDKMPLASLATLGMVNYSYVQLIDCMTVAEAPTEPVCWI